MVALSMANYIPNDAAVDIPDFVEEVLKPIIIKHEAIDVFLVLLDGRYRTWKFSTNIACGGTIRPTAWHITSDCGVFPYEFAFVRPSQTPLPTLLSPKNSAFIADFSNTLIDASMEGIFGLRLIPHFVPPFASMVGKVLRLLLIHATFDPTTQPRPILPSTDLTMLRCGIPSPRKVALGSWTLYETGKRFTDYTIEQMNWLFSGVAYMTKEEENQRVCRS
ncbi:MAG: hypothetical protein MMC33_000624 [Icmadophila ericetorum]|nr:hypothetical protein [Icmadophila ericetorum]